MKHILISFLLFCFPLLANAETVEINGIWYNLNNGNKTAEVTNSPSQYSGDVIIPNKVTYGNVEYSVTSIGNAAFYLCSNLNSLIIPTSVTSIDDRAISNCRSLSSLVIPNSVTYIGNNAFTFCSGLTVNSN